MDPNLLLKPQKLDHSYNLSLETMRLKFWRFINFVMLCIFGTLWILNFIFVGWYGLFAILMAYAWIFTLANGLFSIAKHSQRIFILKKPKIMVVVYLLVGLSFALSFTFFIYGCVELEHEDIRTSPE